MEKEEEKVMMVKQCGGVDEPVSTSSTSLRRPLNEKRKARVDSVQRLKRASIANFFYVTKPRTPREYGELVIYNPVFEVGESSRGGTRDTDDQVEERKRQRRNDDNKKSKIIDGPDPAPTMPQSTMDVILAMGGGQPMLILQKGLFESDLRKNQSRLSLPIKQLESTDFLRDEEKAQAERRRGDGRIEGLRVQVVEPGCHTTTMVFKKWDLNYTSSYVLTNTWQSVVLKRNKISPGDILQIWFFRDAIRNPCFALVKLPPQSTRY